MPPTSYEPQRIGQVTCPRCGVRFGCRPCGDCWCMTEPVRLPLTPDAAAACLCRDCLRAAAASMR